MTSRARHPAPPAPAAIALPPEGTMLSHRNLILKRATVRFFLDLAQALERQRLLGQPVSGWHYRRRKRWLS